MIHRKTHDTNALNALVRTLKGLINPKTDTMTHRKTYDTNALNAGKDLEETN